jgi:hypothetical protein
VTGYYLVQTVRELHVFYKPRNSCAGRRLPGCLLYHWSVQHCWVHLLCDARHHSLVGRYPVVRMFATVDVSVSYVLSKIVTLLVHGLRGRVLVLMVNLWPLVSRGTIHVCSCKLGDGNHGSDKPFYSVTPAGPTFTVLQNGEL